MRNIVVSSLSPAVFSTLLLAAGSTGCGPGPESCEETKSCVPRGSAGSAQTGGSGGSGGSWVETGGGAGSGGTGTTGSGGSGGSVQLCKLDQDCDDGLGCNGIERCASGVCIAGIPTECPNALPKHCSAECEELGANNSHCVARGKDADGDGHLDANCPYSSEPTDDCDDTRATVHPGAAELCDGLDNDCDDKDDLADGHPLGGKANTLLALPGAGAYQPVAAWSEKSNAYGVAWTDEREGAPRIYFALMSQDGSFVSTPVKLSKGAAGAATNPTIVSTGQQLYVAWEDTRDGSPQIWAQRLSNTGNVLDSNFSSTERYGTTARMPALAHFDGQTVLTYTLKNAMGITPRAGILKPQGGLDFATALGTPEQGFAGQTRATALGSTLAVTWDLSVPGTSWPSEVAWTFATAQLTAAAAQPLTPSPAPPFSVSHGPRIGTANENFAVAWRNTDPGDTRVRYAERTASGAMACGPVDIDSAALDTIPQAVAGFAGGALVAIADIGDSQVSAGSVVLARVAKGCTLLDKHYVDTNVALEGLERNVTLARGAEGYAVIWSAGAGSARSLRVRTFGENLCD